jgi:uncharacterized membrane protein
MSTFSLEVPGGWLTAIVLALGFLAAIALTLHRARTLAKDRRWVLSALRIATAVLAWCVAVQPTRTRERADDDPGRLAVLLDTSRSMRVQTGGETRMARAAGLVSGWRAEAEARDVELATFGRQTASRRFNEPREAFVAREDDTRIGDALAALANDTSNLGAALVVSDGADLAGGAIERAETLGLRVHAVFVGDRTPLIDDALTHVDYDRVGFLRRPLRIRADISSHGIAAHTVAVSLFENDTLLREERVSLSEDGIAHLDLEVVPTHLGRVLYRIELPHLAEDVVPENDARSLLVRVQRDNLRALLVAGQPSWDQRFLRAFLKKDPTTDLISFFILRETTDLTMADSEDLALIPFPTDELFSEHLGSFDVVLFQNFEYAPYDMEIYLPRIREYVERGGSFAMIGGPLSFSQAGYAETAVGELLPVEVLPRGTPDSRSLTTDVFQPRITDAARHHPLVQLSSDAATNALAWRQLAPMQGLNVVARVREGAQRVLEHPTLEDDDGEPLPMLVTGMYGRGRVMALMSDTTWRWGITSGGSEGDASGYERFWETALRWLALDPLLDPSRIVTDRERYGPSAPIEVSATLRNTGYVPYADEPITLRILDVHDQERGHASARTTSEGELIVSMQSPDEPGGYRLVAERITGPTEARRIAEEVFVVELGGDELADPRTGADLLRALAERTQGTFTTLEDAPRLESFSSTRARVRELIHDRPFASWPAIAVFACLMGIEWILRRRWGA